MSYSFEVIAADVVGDMAYTVGYEHTQASIDGEPRVYTLRVTQVYRREHGEWKVAHRHGDTLSSEPTRAAIVSSSRPARHARS
jgi:ketosteroid isomerase-like protein